MNILVIGSGAREHALARAIVKSKRGVKLFCYASSLNPGIRDLTEDYHLGDICLVNNVVSFAKMKAIAIAVIGPEAPLAVGLADALWEENIPTVGPKKNLAQIETSKAFTRDLMMQYKIPGCPNYRYYHSMSGVKEFLDLLGDNYVVKANGLMGGKGVKVAGEHLLSHADALQFCEQLVAKKASFVIEKKCIGPEFSLISFSDGKHLSHMPLVQDHKRAFVGDTGPNTGGMGSVSFANHKLPFVSDKDVADAQAINEKIVDALFQETGERFIGFLYGGYMATADGVSVIEFNARFGDPEAVNLLPLLDTDFVDILQAMVSGSLSQCPVHFSQKATVCKYAVPEGYPENPEKGEVVSMDAVEKKDQIFLAAVDEVDGQLIETGSRTIAVLGIADTVADAGQQAELIMTKLQGPLFHRSDIGTHGLINERIKLINGLRHEHYELLPE